MAKEPPAYEVNDEFNQMAVSLVEKYPEKFANIPVDKICCVNVTNKDNPKVKEDVEGVINSSDLWKLQNVKMPMALHCPYGYYVILFQSDWDKFSEKHKLALVADVLHGVGSEGTVNPCDTKGYHSVLNTLGLDYLNDSNIPHLLEDEVSWKK